jgi:uncharacterized protein (TIRG00374 family)
MKRWHFWAGLLISAIFLFFAMRGLQIDLLWDTVQSAKFWWLIPATLVYFLAVWARTWRWYFLLLPIQPITTAKIFPILNIGYMGNNIFPARAGELIRSVLLKRKHDVSISASLATILVERIFDGVVVLGFIFLNLGSVLSTERYQYIAFLGSAIFIGTLLILFLIALFPKKAGRFYRKLISWFIPKKWREAIIGFLDRFTDGLSSLRSPSALLMVFLSSVVIWAIESIVYWLVMRAFPFEVSFLNLVFMNGVVNLATTLPSAPGYIGTFDAPGIALLKAFGVEGTIAAGYTLVLHAVLWLPITLLGLYFFMKEGLNLGEGLNLFTKESGEK